jgi:hypothetical protein
MIILNSHLFRHAGFPVEANSPLIIDPDAVLACTVTAKEFEPVTGR